VYAAASSPATAELAARADSQLMASTDVSPRERLPYPSWQIAPALPTNAQTVSAARRSGERTRQPSSSEPFCAAVLVAEVAGGDGLPQSLPVGPRPPSVQVLPMHRRNRRA
jgi:hypothetical protein